MDWWNIVVKGLKKRRKQTFMILAGIFFGAFMMTVIFSTFMGMKHKVEEDIAKYGETHMFRHESSEQQISYRGIPLMIESSVHPEKLTIKEVGAIEKANPDAIGISPRAVRTFKHNGNSELALIGIEFEQERNMKPWWKVWGNWPSHEGQVVLGYDIAQKFNYRAGDSLTAEIDGKPYNLQIAGYLHYTGYVDDRLIYTSVNQPFFSEGIDFVEGVFKSEAVPHKAEVSSGWSWVKTKSANQERMDIVEKIAHITPIIFAVAIVMGGIITCATLLSQVEERRKEFAVWRAIGMTRSWILKILLGEVSCLALIGSVIGWVFGLILAIAMASLMSSFAFTATIPIEQSLLIILVSILVSVISSIYPILLALRQDPLALLKS